METRKMFSSDRYVTRGVNEVVPFELQLLLWSILEKRQERGDQLDHLQIFELSAEWVDGEPVQKVLNRQEQPFHEEVFYVDHTENLAIGVTVWIMDSGEYSTLLLPEEY
ncbi:DUF960 family protein [Brevibacillus centrosporus]|uniref:DUF960 family protein n=1 Tax=Brevibacillus centrosporus TaxID=54910 RepID=UPI000F0A20CC|nr:DUF960 family protein [Brevibacillus centrosporus]MEC2130527.1 DUF960 family protein [Brevibacillus centrosporus]RNB68870.1 hypothetical protein EDM55_15775 [Brevibacillus centrosporus]GED34933.1 hypothetical protein BCE02nite_60740 [Brevibacillus centrosporus]